MSNTNMPAPARGAIRHLTRKEVVDRALSMILAMPLLPIGTPKPIAYRLDDSGLLGGRDPHAPHCADLSFGGRTWTSDCIGLALWASGIDRLQPGFKGSRGAWLNCASLLDDAKGDMRYCRELMSGEGAKPGDWLLTKDHIGVIVRVKTPGFDYLVVDCSPRHGRPTAINTGGPWSGECEPIRPLFYAEP